MLIRKSCIHKHLVGGTHTCARISWRYSIGVCKGSPGVELKPACNPPPPPMLRRYSYDSIEVCHCIGNSVAIRLLLLPPPTSAEMAPGDINGCGIKRNVFGPYRILRIKRRPLPPSPLLRHFEVWWCASWDALHVTPTVVEYWESGCRRLCCE